MLSGIPDEWGPKFQCQGGAVTRTHTGPNDVQYIAPAHMAVVLFTAQPRRQIALNSDRRIVGTAPVGALEIVPAQSEVYARWMVEKQSLLVAMEPCRLNRLAGAQFDTETFELHPPPFGLADDKAHMLARWMRSELENPLQGCEESLDALITLFSIHLLKFYSSLRSRPQREFTGGLPSTSWRRVDDFIRSNLSQSLPLERLAAIASLSPGHFARAFKQTTGESPHQYVISARLAHARHLIVDTDAPLGEIAKSAGFSSNSHMTAMMRRAWMTTPTELRRQR